MDGLPDGRADGWTDGRAGRQGISQVYKPIQPSESRRRCDDLSRLGALVTCTLIAVHHHTYHGHPGERAVGIEAASIQAGSSLTQRALHIEPTTGGSARLKCRAHVSKKSLHLLLVGGSQRLPVIGWLAESVGWLAAIFCFSSSQPGPPSTTCSFPEGLKVSAASGLSKASLACNRGLR